jgi:hypothetical protein
MPPKNAAASAPAAAPTPPAPAPAPAAPPVSDYVREAVREKASRDWQQLRQRSEAFGALERLLETLASAERELAVTAPIVLSAAPNAGLGSKIKKLRKTVDEATGLSRDIVHALGGATSRESLEEARRAILDALRSAGLDEAALDARPAVGEVAPAPTQEDAAEAPATDETAPADA